MPMPPFTHYMSAAGGGYGPNMPPPPTQPVQYGAQLPQAQPVNSNPYSAAGNGYSPPGYGYHIVPVPKIGYWFGVPFMTWGYEMHVTPPSPAPNVTPNLGAWPDAQ